MKIGEEFNKVASRNVLCEISNALTSLHSDLLYLEPNDANSTFDEFAETLKKTITCYIDNQKTVFRQLRSDS